MILVKAIAYRMYQSLITFLIALLFTHKFETAAQIVGLEVVIKIGTYYLFERLWYNKRNQGLPGSAGKEQITRQGN